MHQGLSYEYLTVFGSRLIETDYGPLEERECIVSLLVAGSTKHYFVLSLAPYDTYPIEYWTDEPEANDVKNPFSLN